MGGHYGSIHVRADDANSIIPAVSSLAEQGKQRFLVAPPIKGWVSVFPSNNGQDASVAEQLAKLLPEAEFIQCLVHDDDLFCYWYFRKGALIDRYNSCPDYFDDRNTEPRGGNAQALEHLLAKPGTVADLQSLLDTKQFDFEMLRLEKFAKLLNLPNAVTAYEYLQDGERDGIKQWRKFIHVPDRSSERNAARTAAVALRAEMKRLKEEGVLLLDLAGPKTPGRSYSPQPNWCVHPTRSEILMAWQQWTANAPETTTPLVRVSAAGTANDPREIALPKTVHNLIVSRSGRWLAAGCAFGDWQGQLWDLETGKMALAIPQNRAVTMHCFTPDDKHVIASSEGTINVVSVDDLKVTSSARLDLGPQDVAAHPGGGFIAVVSTDGFLSVVDLTSLSIVAQAWVKDLHSVRPPNVLEQNVAKVGEALFDIMKARKTEAELQEYRLQVARSLLPRDWLRALAFSADGKWLFCGSRDGLHVLAWQEALASAKLAEIKPAFSVEAKLITRELRGGMTYKERLTYAVIFDESRQRVLFCGLNGTIQYLELADGRSGDLFVSPERLPTWKLSMFPDRSALICTVQGLKDNERNPAHVQMWSYPELCRRAGIPF